MSYRNRRCATVSALVVAAFAACTTPNPNYRKPHSDAGVDGAPEGGGGGGGGGGSCESGAALRCDGMNLIRCNADGHGEVIEPCALGCNAAKLQCATDIDPSNGLAPVLDKSNGERDFELGSSATINTDTGEVKVGGAPVAVRSETLAQDSAPIIRVFIVHSLMTGDVFVTGKNALAIVSHGDIKIGGVFRTDTNPSPGMYNDGGCKGQVGQEVSDASAYRHGGNGGGGFGSPGGRGGFATISAGTADGGLGGVVTGNATLVPLRGGCGTDIGGGAIQLVSRTRIVISGAVAANGAGGLAGAGGGSGGGILLEAPAVELEKSGKVLANGGGGGGGGFCFPDSPPQTSGRAGELAATPASGGLPCNGIAAGGLGGAGNADGTNGDPDIRTTSSIAWGGGGGGGVGRIRINTLPLGFHTMGLLSPNPSPGSLATR